MLKKMDTLLKPSELINIIKYCWKKILLVTIVFICVGIIVGYFYARNSPSQALWHIDTLQIREVNYDNDGNINITQLQQDLETCNIYFNSLKELLNKNNPDYIMQKIDDIQNLENNLSNLSSYYYTFYPTSLENLALTKLDLENSIQQIEYDIVKAEIDRDTYQILSQNPQGLSVNPETTQKLLSSFENLGEYYKLKTYYTNQLNIINDTPPEEMDKHYQYMQASLSKMENDLLGITNSINDTITEIAEKENYLIYIQYDETDKNKIHVNILSGYTEDSFYSKFSAIVIISALLGVILGFYLSALQYIKTTQRKGEHHK